MQKLLRITAAIASAFILQLCAAAGYYAWKLPDSFYITEEDGLSVSSAIPITAKPVESDSLAAFSDLSFTADTVSLRLMGIIPIKNAEVQTIETPVLTAGGHPFGIKLRMDGVMVIRLGDICSDGKTLCPAKDAGICSGDIIETADGVPIDSSDTLRSVFEQSQGKPVEIEFTRNGKEHSADIKPVYSAVDDCYSAGIWVRDSLAGVGTMTFYDPNTQTFAGLGHPICDGDTGVCIPIGEGSACPVTISSLVKSRTGDPGMLEGTFQKGNDIGTLVSNNSCGVFGKLSSGVPDSESLPMAFKQEIQKGEAEIICTVSGEVPDRYTIIIEEIDYNGSDNTKNMVIRITDKKLIEKTGGIVQGMSGSPIIQNGKIVGAVTHVFVDDPERGYGIFCENMYRQCIALGG